MSNQQRTQVYQQALSDAQSELDQILAEFNELASRKDRLEHVMNVLTPLLDLAQAGPSMQAAPAQQFAPPSARTFEPLTPRNYQAPPARELQQHVNNFAQNPTQDPTVEPAPVEVVHQTEPVAPVVLAEAAQPEQAVVLQQQETPRPEVQPASSGDRLEDRINFALNFALLS